MACDDIKSPVYNFLSLSFNIKDNLVSLFREEKL
jgi:hypothetical protein